MIILPLEIAEPAKSLFLWQQPSGAAEVGCMMNMRDRHQTILWEPDFSVAVAQNRRIR
jgi:hypothetical protein